jgi:glycine cleavage system H protein
MAESLEYRYDKFVFRVPRGLRYSAADLWLRVEGDQAVIGVTDFLQQRSGDAAFVELVAEGTHLAVGEALGQLETIKATATLNCPVAGTVVTRNEDLEMEPERVNQDPYGAGWLVSIALDDPTQLDGLLTDAAYLELLAEKVAAESAKL